MSPRHTTPAATFKRRFVIGALSGVAVGATTIALVSVGPTSDDPTRLIFYRAAAPGHPAHIPVPAKPAKYLPKPPPAKRRLPKHLPSAADVLKIALSQVGVTENAVGGTKFNQWFMSTSAALLGAQQYGGSVSDYANAAWCDMFVSWVGAQAGVPGIGVDAYTPSHARWFEQQGRWGGVAKPGAVVFFSFSGDKSIGGIEHTGLVIKDNQDGTIQTVEGNTDDTVKVRIRDISDVVGYGYPDYAR
ncbi:hypothetical protein GCM10023196_005860 [Actinoallomurus vinaceus]|uniref:Peptidase C51 domain-containing protein n=1 Tax=Actinoallomurus vinaceus TaxID=1080074 RepID=A0ABP8U0M1_9ACTN